MDTETVDSEASSWCKQLFCSRTEGKALYAFIPEDPPFKAPFKAQCRGKTSASSIKTPGAVNKPIPAPPPPAPSQLPGEARHLRFHFAPLLCLLHLPQKPIGKLACAWRGGGTDPHRGAEILAWGRGCSCHPDGAGGDSCCHPHSCHIPSWVVAVPNKWHDAGQKGTPSPSALLLPDLQTQPEAGRGMMAIVLSLLETTVSQRAPSDSHDTE